MKCTYDTSETQTAGPVTHLRLYSHNGAEPLLIAKEFPILYGYLSFVNMITKLNPIFRQLNPD